MSMMSDMLDEWYKRTGGSAFPVPNDADVNDMIGMSLLDWFAGQALAGMDWLNSNNSYETDAAACYDMAEQMIKERIARNK